MIGLPMYDEDQQALRTFLVGLRRHLEQAGLKDTTIVWPAPDLERHWLSPNLLLSQTCGYPLATALAGKVRLVATPRYTAPGCAGSDYRSVIVVRHDDPARVIDDLLGRRAAFNARDSQSGYNALRDAVAHLNRGGRVFSEVIESGEHKHSMRLVQDGPADVAAIDCVTYALMQRVAPRSTEGLRVLAWSRAAPGLPLISAGETSDEEIAALRTALAKASADPALAQARHALLLDGFDVRPLSDYRVCLSMEQRAGALGYLDLA
jgi:ABC-type phosphate/phosphonate transport system substrate-binding protein